MDWRDKTLINGWLPKNGEHFQIDSIDIQGAEVRYISAIGRYEIASSPSRAIIDNRVLPREYRIFNKAVNAVFFELHGRVYCVLEVSVSQEGKVRSVLFGQGYKHKKTEWGKVASKQLPQFSLDSRFFYWIFSKRGQQLNVVLEDSPFVLNILDVSAVSQLSDRNVHDNRNEGPDVLGSVPALSGLCINQNVYEGGFHLLINNIQLYCRFSSDCTCALDSSRSIITRGENVAPVINDFPNLAITVYTLLVLGLLATFHRETQVGGWTVVEENEQRKKWALQVILEYHYLGL